VQTMAFPVFTSMFLTISIGSNEKLIIKLFEKKLSNTLNKLPCVETVCAS